MDQKVDGKEVISLSFLWKTRWIFRNAGRRLCVAGCKLRSESHAMLDEHYRLWAKGDQLSDASRELHKVAQWVGCNLDERSRTLCTEGTKLRELGDKLWADGIKDYGPMKWTWNANGVCRCALETGEVFEYEPEQPYEQLSKETTESWNTGGAQDTGWKYKAVE